MPESAPTTQLPLPERGEELQWVQQHLGELTLEGPGGIAASSAFRGGQRAADGALARYDVSGYARERSGVWPPSKRGASQLSPYIRHGLLPLPRVWRAVDGGPSKDVRKFRDELLWQEYARHVYARLGTATRRPLRREPPGSPDPGSGNLPGGDPWPEQMACMAQVTKELHENGWLVNQTRMWMASQWTVRAGWDWKEGEDRFFTHLLDGSRAANRLGWQWTVGAGTGRPYGFSRWQVEKRAKPLCDRCELKDACPVEDFPDADAGPKVDEHPRLRRDDDPERTSGPMQRVSPGDDGYPFEAAAVGGSEPGGAGASAGPPAPEAVWLTAESLGDEDPALAAHADLPAIFVFDQPLLERLRLSGKRLIFLAETLADLAERRDVELHLGDPVDVLRDRPVATTFAPVPGFRSRAAEIAPVEVHPWLWLARPRSGTLASFSAWRKQLPV